MKCETCGYYNDPNCESRFYCSEKDMESYVANPMSREKREEAFPDCIYFPPIEEGKDWIPINRLLNNLNPHDIKYIKSADYTKLQEERDKAVELIRDFREILALEDISSSAIENFLNQLEEKG